MYSAQCQECPKLDSAAGGCSCRAQRRMQACRMQARAELRCDMRSSTTDHSQQRATDRSVVPRVGLYLVAGRTLLVDSSTST
jgi:hypothetical protein